MAKMTRSDLASGLPIEGCPLAYLRGEISALVEAYEEPELQRLLGEDALIVTVPGAGHQVMIDQPLGLVEALTGLLARWPTADKQATMASPSRSRTIEESRS